jgi:hypothetical protein
MYDGLVPELTTNNNGLPTDGLLPQMPLIGSGGKACFQLIISLSSESRFSQK